MQGTLRTIAFMAGGLAAGFTLATWMSASDPDAGWVTPEAVPLAARIGDLERRLAWEAEARVALRAELDALREEVDSLSEFGAASPSAQAEPVAGLARAARAVFRGAGDAPPDENSAPASLAEVAARVRRALPTQDELARRRVERFVEAGFPPDRAEWLERRTSELRMQALEEEYRAARSGEARDPRTASSVDQLLRAELGDDDYGRYLAALGRPARVGIRGVLPSSPAEQAGLQPGDELVAYAGRRVFDMNDLNRLTFEGNPGDIVAIDVIRDGQSMQIFVPRGPIGITGGGRLGRRP
jgi:hypothetical protein